jgi:hypothetical protein
VNAGRSLLSTPKHSAAESVVVAAKLRQRVELAEGWLAKDSLDLLLRHAFVDALTVLSSDTWRGGQTGDKEQQAQFRQF